MKIDKETLLNHRFEFDSREYLSNLSLDFNILNPTKRKPKETKVFSLVLSQKLPQTIKNS